MPQLDSCKMSALGNTAQLLDHSTVEEVTKNAGIWRNSGKHLQFDGEDREGREIGRGQWGFRVSCRCSQ
jgi:hypothetical protein